MPSKKRRNQGSHGTAILRSDSAPSLNEPGAAPSQPSRNQVNSSPKSRSWDLLGRREELLLRAIWDTCCFWIGYVMDVGTHAVVLAKKPLAAVLILYMTYVGLLRIMESAIPAVLTPICQMPLMPHVIPICDDILRPYKTPHPDFPNLMSIQDKFETILDETSSGTTVALELKKSEMAVRDLTNLVRVSNLVAKEKLSIMLDAFVGSAKTAGRELQRLGSRVGGTVDNILAMNDYVLHSLEEAHKPSQEGHLASVVHALLPIGPSSPQRALQQRREIESLWFQATGALESNIARLITQAEASLVLLNRLEEDLEVINQMIGREAHHMREKTDELLAELWTRLGGNRKQLANFKSHRALLANIRVYRNRALSYVTSTLVQLQQLSSDLEDLRDRVSMPLIAGPESNIPLEVHINSIRMGIDRLSEGRSQAKAREDAYLRQLLDDTEQLSIGNEF